MAAPVSGQLIRASDSFLLNTFTPSWTNFTIGSGAASEGWYQQIGSMVLWGFMVEIGSSPAFSASILMALPVNCYVGAGSTGLARSLGTWAFRAAAGTNYAGSIINNDSGGTTAVFKAAWSGTVPSSNIGTTSSTPATPASGNILSGSGVYRAA